TMNRAAMVETSKLFIRTGSHAPNTKEVPLSCQCFDRSIQIRNRRKHQRRQRKCKDKRTPETENKTQQEGEQQHNAVLELCAKLEAWNCQRECKRQHK